MPRRTHSPITTAGLRPEVGAERRHLVRLPLHGPCADRPVESTPHEYRRGSSATTVHAAASSGAKLS
ncbi:hypothetical protein [Streptomyces sp. NRRL F-5630]|uniref:hypothetical protein n=1 Tax=Streptomyces sp. NRRL F-5630 TaxID=1463864 RepID=UPI003D75E976